MMSPLGVTKELLGRVLSGTISGTICAEAFKFVSASRQKPREASNKVLMLFVSDGNFKKSAMVSI